MDIERLKKNPYYKPNEKELQAINSQEIRAIELTIPTVRRKRSAKRKRATTKTTTQEISRDTLSKENIYPKAKKVSNLPDFTS